MFSLIVFFFCIFAVIGTGILAGYSDYRGLKIPNGYSAVILGLFPFCYALLWLTGDPGVFQSLSSHVLALLIVFCGTAALFSFGVLGAADSKLASALAFWTGLKGLMGFIFFTTIFGAVLAFVALVLRKYKPVKSPAAGTWVDTVQKGESKVPYGIALVCGALTAFCDIGYFDLDALVRIFNL